MLENINVNNTVQQQAENNIEAQKESEIKTFTQEEVDDIVEKRLKRERNRFSQMLNGRDPKEQEYAEREEALAKRELQLEMRDIIKGKQLPDSILDYLNYKDKESCEKSLEALEAIIHEGIRAKVDERLKGDPPPKKAGIYAVGRNNDLKKAFKL